MQDLLEPLRPAEGDDYRQVDPGISFADLPGDWSCPNCGAPKEQFMVFEDPGAAQVAEVARLDALTAGRVADFREIWHAKMRDVPMVNKFLTVEAVGFRMVEGRPLGVLISPWFMNLIQLPAEGEDWSQLIPGAKELITFPSGEYEFVHNTREMTGGYKACSLFSPVADMVLGQSPNAAADLLPRLFNLCRVAQSVAARAAFGLPQDPDWRSNLRAEIIREHVVKLCLKWLAPCRLMLCLSPKGGRAARPRRAALFGPSGQMPRSGDAVQSFLTSGTGIAVVLRAISDWFAPGEGVRAALPLATPDTALTITPQENSPAARHANHPAMQYVARIWGWLVIWMLCGRGRCQRGICNRAAPSCITAWLRVFNPIGLSHSPASRPPIISWHRGDRCPNR